LPILANDPFRSTPTTSTKEWKTSIIDLVKNCKTADLDPDEKKAFFILLVGVLPPKELSNIELFCNQNGERMVLSKLIASSKSVEPWLEDFRIDVHEDSLTLQNHLAKETDIFNNILSTEWDSITAHSTVAPNISSFYQGVLKYATLAQSPKPLITNKYIFVDNTIGFVSSAQIFYHQEMVNFDKYGALKAAINAVTDMQAPHPDVLELVSEPVLKTRNGILAKSIANDAVILDKSEAASLVHFFENTKEDLFTFLYIVESQENPRECEVGKRF
jgi:hypothetical protein